MSDRNRIELHISKARSRLRKIERLEDNALTPEIRTSAQAINGVCRYSAYIQVYDPKKANGQVQGPCPICDGDDRFWIHEKDGRFGCRGCEPGGQNPEAGKRIMSGLDKQNRLGYRGKHARIPRHDGMVKRRAMRNPAAGEGVNQIEQMAADLAVQWRV